jgi:16S rRNA (guanine966-N2)-methyltransferase
LRIISGSAKGRKLSGPGNQKSSCCIRPTSDRAREALFNIIGRDKILNRSVLDLFAGTGALGIEALSRGAAAAFFVDYHKAAIQLIQHNLSLCGFTAASLVVKRDLEKGLFFFRDTTGIQKDNVFPEIFDLVFLDPPYDQERSEFYLTELQEYSLIGPDSLVIYEDRSRQNLLAKIGALSLYDQRKYGDSGFWFYKL